MKKQILETFHKFGLIIKTIDKSTDEKAYRQFYPQESVVEKRFYNIGAGAFDHPCWTNIDGDSDWYLNINGDKNISILYDMFKREPLAIADNSAELVYTSHTIEHADDLSVQSLFNDCQRVLKKDGVLRIVTPNADNAFRAWQSHDRTYFFWIDWDSLNVDFEKQCLSMPLREATLTQIFLEDFASGATTITTVGNEKRIDDAELHRLFNELPFEQAMDYCTSLCSIEDQKKYPFRHINWFNETKLTRMLKEAGFSEIRKSAYLQSEVPVLRNPKFFDQTLPQISMYMEAVK